MRRIHDANDEITCMTKISYMQKKDSTQGLICITLHAHDGMVMYTLNEDGSEKRMVNHIKRLMRKQEPIGMNIKDVNGSGITVSDEQ